MSNRLLIVRLKMLALIETLDTIEITRDEPASWEKIHMVSSSCIGYELAKKRGVDPELAAVACAVHDIGRVHTGRQQDHAKVGRGYAHEFLTGLNKDSCVENCGSNLGCNPLFTAEEIEEIAKAVAEHSNKNEISAPLCEIVKDADVLDMHYYDLDLPRAEQRERLEAMLLI